MRICSCGIQGCNSYKPVMLEIDLSNLLTTTRYGENMALKSKVKVIYLDQKCWIDIAKEYYSEPSRQERELVQKIIEASRENRAIFPLSISHLDETMRISDDERRNRLAFLMVKISKGYAFQPYVDRNIRNEVRNIVLKKLGLPVLNIQDYALKQGISHILGARAKLEPKKEAKNELPKEIKKKLLDLLESPETLEFALKQKMPRSMDRGRDETVMRMEENRKGLSNVKDNDLRKRVFLARNITAIVLPELAKTLYECKLPRDFIIKEKSSRRDIETFLDSVPSALCLFTLIYQRDQQLQRPIVKNDTNDVWFLTLAVPYSDIVVTEKMWASIIKQAHLDRKCNTTVLSSINELEEYL